MRKVHARNAGVVLLDRCATFYTLPPACDGDGLFAHDVFGGLVLPHALERRLPHTVAVGPAMEINLNHHSWLNPDRFARASLLGGNRFERCFRSLHGLELAEKRARDFVRETGSGASCIVQLAALIEAKHKSSDSTRIGGRRYDSGDHEFLTIRTFGLDPVMTAPRTIWSVSDFRHNAFQSHFAGVLKQC